ncbi:D-amino-acid transaminase [Acuticoccus sp. I52.16.1]|uniref:D-amino-acid transaminase n=1 Tax=Acuticoccus sp. I52.16.1 TaxID=2928472 RepID=UPI001FD0B0D8|nr:D-amino-acid transaminase [Acuticoccus sp. I52.16.1]UOM34582.1 D-amino-acid transaminase [Acuticoccus sp. I52.16.1]
MSRIAYVNGRYLPHAQAHVHVEDRGFQFADGVYEVCEIWNGHIVDMTRHLDRLGRSLTELQMDWPLERRAMETVLRETARRNRVKNGLVYLQVTRGQARRDFAFPKLPIPTTLVVTARSTSPSVAVKNSEDGIAVVTTPDIRWERVDIKTVSLLPQVLAKQKAVRAGAKEAWMYDKEGYVTEGASSNAWIVAQDGTLITRPAEKGILRGITRAAIMDYAATNGIKVEERHFTLEEAKAAREAFITSATMLATAVVKIDDAVIGNGQPGSIVSAMRARFHEGVEKLPLSVY